MEPVSTIPPALTPSTPKLSAVLDGLTILVTGGAGFVGSAVLLRLLQTPSLAPKRVVAIIRGDKPAQRLPGSLQPLVAKILPDGTVEDHKPLVVFRGDVSVGGFALDPVAAKLLELLQVDIVIHCAADVKFKHPLKEAMRANCGMAFAMAEFSATTPSVKTHIQVSTCYTGTLLPHNSMVAEELVPSAADVLFGEHISTYTHSKCVAEGIVNAFARAGTDVAWAVVRLSTVSPALGFPDPMWGAETTGSPLCALISAQPLPPNLWHPDAHVDCIPVDLCVNQLLGLAAATHLSARYTVPRKLGFAVPVFHVASTNSVIPTKLYNLSHVKIAMPFITPSTIDSVYRPMHSKVVAFDTTRTRSVLGMEALQPSATLIAPVVNMEGFDLDTKVGFEHIGGLEKYLVAVRDAMEVAGKEKLRRKALARKAKL